MKSSELLRLAKARIVRRQSVHVCVATAQALKEHEIAIGSMNAPAVVQNLRSLFGKGSVSTWLWENSKEYRQFFLSAQTVDECRKALQAYRLRWIDWMIEGYERVGD